MHASIQLPYFLSGFLLLSLFTFSFSLHVFSSLFFPTSCLLPLFYCLWLPFYTVCHYRIYNLCPSIVFGFLWATLQDCPLTAGCLGITSTQSVLVAPLSISRQNYLSCFLPLSIFVSPQWIRIKLPHHRPLWHASSGPSPHLPLLGEMSSQQDIPLKKLGREPQNRPPFLPTAKPHPLNTLTYSPPPMYCLGTNR